MNRSSSLEVLLVEEDEDHRLERRLRLREVADFLEQDVGAPVDRKRARAGADGGHGGGLDPLVAQLAQGPAECGANRLRVRPQAERVHGGVDDVLRL
jgi:hypothetical protein